MNIIMILLLLPFVNSIPSREPSVPIPEVQDYDYSELPDVTVELHYE